jgi:hypothetical protein
MSDKTCLETMTASLKLKMISFKDHLRLCVELILKWHEFGHKSFIIITRKKIK